MRPKPARIEVLPLVPGEYARPMRGINAFFMAVGAWNVISPGTLEIALTRLQRLAVGDRLVFVAQAQVQGKVRL